MDIKYFDRKTNTIETEHIYGEAFMRWLYSTTPGEALQPILVRRFFSKIYGFFQTLPFSTKKISGFIKQFNIDMSQFQVEEYRSFNQFFIRRFRPGMREIAAENHIMPAGCEARYLGFAEVSEQMTFPVKGREYTAAKFLASQKWADEFANGPLLIARLAPVDYHRFHFPDEGTIVDQYRVTGKFHSVSPVAIKENAQILTSNERQVTILQTKHFGKIAMVEVGALCVGAIVQTYESNHFERGQEKGYFLFGGSTVAFLGTKGAWVPTDDIRDYSLRGIETLVKLGDGVAISQSRE